VRGVGANTTTFKESVASGSYKYGVQAFNLTTGRAKLGLDTSQVRRLLAKGEIKGKKLGHDWVVLSLGYKRKRRPKRSKK